MRVEARHSNVSLVVVGTVHGDPKGYSKLVHFLKTETPDYLTVEISPYAREFRRQQGSILRGILRSNLRQISRIRKTPLRRILAHPAILGLFILLKEPYEWRAAYDYARENGKSVEDIDLSAYSREKLAYLKEMTALENLMCLLDLPFEGLSELVDAQYRRARNLFSHPPTSRISSSEMAVREIYMAERIRSLVRRAKEAKFIHIGGWEHLVDFPGKNSLWGRLKNLPARRILLQGENAVCHANPRSIPRSCPGLFQRN